MATFHEKLAELQAAIVQKGECFYRLTERAVECYFDLDTVKAGTIAQLDDEVDRVDVEIERAPSFPVSAAGLP